ncbi:hypothetical protein LTR24_003776 [Lithohypha guttulata]|uniref:Uncharacterized protein n=1 Tax=Lithohypha guttulata TaxID=1690604 RepID=A0ABR0KE19_9EURO|nr:hypothetical protein LTR24_003776 [Lithohypha guttulata]
MASSNNNVNDPFADNAEDQQGGQPTEQSTYPAPEGAPPGQGEDSNTPLPHERKLSESGRLAVEKKAEAKRAKAEARYYARKERIENMFTSNPDHPKALKKQSKLEMKHKKWLAKIDKKRDKQMAIKKDRFEHPEKTTSKKKKPRFHGTSRSTVGTGPDSTSRINPGPAAALMPAMAAGNV